MQNDGLEVSYLNLIDEEDAPYFLYRYGELWGIPAARERLELHFDEPLFAPHPGLARAIEVADPARHRGKTTTSPRS